LLQGQAFLLLDKLVSNQIVKLSSSCLGKGLRDLRFVGVLLRHRNGVVHVLRVSKTHGPQRVIQVVLLVEVQCGVKVKVVVKQTALGFCSFVT